MLNTVVSNLLSKDRKLSHKTFVLFILQIQPYASEEKDHKPIQFLLYFRRYLEPQAPLYNLSKRVDRQLFETTFSPLYCPDNGRPAKPIRLMVGLLILKHIRNISDESIVEQWSENLYYQYFCGLQEFIATVPCEASELVHFRHRIGEAGIELIFKESIRINGDDSDDRMLISIQPFRRKRLLFPSIVSCIKKTLQIVKKKVLSIRQSYTKILKKTKCRSANSQSSQK